ncbi:hypothetical protein BDZ91DRAFT_845905 [Kalaharituber pfeilii]|nr:hypothetical protein BDZ91DRAFT_845905 [Kalaharituber pfeilii]
MSTLGIEFGLVPRGLLHLYTRDADLERKVAINGIGGLGHMGLLFAKALGVDKVIAIPCNSSKKHDVLDLAPTSLSLLMRTPTGLPIKLASSLIASQQEIKEMLGLVAEKNVPDVPGEQGNGVLNV